MKKIVQSILGFLILASMTQNGLVFSNTMDAFTDERVVVFNEDAVCEVDGFSNNEINTQVNLQISAKSAYVTDERGRHVIYAKDELKRLPIASMCKIMTLILVFDAIDNGDLAYEEEVQISENAAGMGGSQVFLEAHAKYQVNDLIKSIVVCSANDSCVALAEKICGSEGIFTDRMNEKAKQIGADNTLFANCTGLPKEPQYSCAKDVSLMLKELISHKKYFEYGKIWMDKFQHPEGRYTEISNTNRLVRYYDGCDGGKTGFTNQAGFCLAATAKRGDMRVISVVIGEETSNNRFSDVREMFDYAFANYTVQEILQANQVIEEKSVNVSGGKLSQIGVYPSRSGYVFGKRGEKKNITLDYELYGVKAPCEKGEKVGQVIVYENNVAIDTIDLLTAEAVARAGFYDSLQKIARQWNLK